MALAWSHFQVCGELRCARSSQPSWTATSRAGCGGCQRRTVSDSRRRPEALTKISLLLETHPPNFTYNTHAPEQLIFWQEARRCLFEMSSAIASPILCALLQAYSRRRSLWRRGRLAPCVCSTRKES